MDYLIYYVTAFVMVIFSKAAAWNRFANVRFRKPESERIGDRDVPEHLGSVFAAAEKYFTDRDFVFSHFSVTASNQADDNVPIFTAVFLHPGTCSYVSVRPHAKTDGLYGFDPVFTAIYKNSAVITANTVIGFRVPENYRYSDIHEADPGELWKSHCSRTESEKESAKKLAPDEYIAFTNRFNSDLIDFQVRQRIFAESGPGQWRFRLAKIPAVSRTSEKKEKKRAASVRKLGKLKKKSESAAEYKESVIAANTDIFERGMKPDPQPGRGVRLAVFGASLLMFLLVFGFVLKDIYRLMLLTGIIFMHEAGHFAGMKIAGYKDIQILFVPFIGGAVLGEEDNVKPWQKLLFFYMGPGPGIVIGLICIFCGKKIEGVFFLIVNYLNLIPVSPLDGGKIFEIMYFSKYPESRFFFWFAGFLTMLTVGVLSADPVTFAIGVVILFTLPAQRNIGSAVSEARKSVLPGDGRREKVFAVSGVLFEFPRLLSVQNAKIIFRELNAQSPALPTVIVGTIVYSALMWPLLWYCLSLITRA